MTCKRSVVVVGGGASGALVAANLVRFSRDVRVTVIEPREELGRGMAYSTTCPLHLLNVPALKMSAFPDDPPHFVRWLHAAGRTEYTETSFVPRMIYGDYLRETVRSFDSSRLLHKQGRAVRFERAAGGVEVHLDNGASVGGDALVLALGNAAPAVWPGLSDAVIASGRFFGIAWMSAATAPADREEPVLLLGTGLTAVDAALALRYNGHRGSITMISRRGLLPCGHQMISCMPMPYTGATSARALVRDMRIAARDAEILIGNWRVAVDGVRAKTNDIWGGLSLPEKGRFLRHARAYWDVHRHRMAPEVAALIQSLLEAGTLQVIAGRTGVIEAVNRGLVVSVRRRGSRKSETIRVGRVINCTGPEANLDRVPNPLVRDMLANGSMLRHPLRTGVLVTGRGALVGSDGEPSRDLFAVGPLCMGTLLETVAIPEIRQQASDLAELLLGETAASESEQFAGVTARL